MKIFKPSGGRHCKPADGKVKRRLLALALAMALLCSCLMPVYANSVAMLDDYLLDDGFGVDSFMLDEGFGVGGEDDYTYDLAPGVTESVDADGNIVFTWDDSTYVDWTDDDAIATPYPDGEQMDPGFAIPTNIYRFWLMEKDAVDLAAFEADVAMAVSQYDMTEYDATELYGPNYGMYTLIAIADGGTMSDNTVLNPTEEDAPSAANSYFAGWYTLDEFGDKQSFEFDDTVLWVSTSATIDVFAEWSNSIGQQAEQPNAELAAEQTYQRWFAQLISCSDEAFNDLIDQYVQDAEFEAWLDNLSEDEILPLSERLELLAVPGGPGGNGPGGGGSGGDAGSSVGEIDADKYDPTDIVYWDTVTKLAKDGESVGGNNGAVNVESVYLNQLSVQWGNSNLAIGWGGNPNTLGNYFPGATAGKNNMTDSTMSITTSVGYYVTGVVVACAPYPEKTNLSPFNCSTWNENNAFFSTFDLSDSTYNSDGTYTLDFSINSKWFSHSGDDPNAYFILITVAAVPTPLYVEYNYGEIGTLMGKGSVITDSSSEFYTPTWTTETKDNAYGTGSKLTTDTQFKYMYNETSEVKNWKHTANSVSAAALAEAAAAGYYFTGWKATYYNEVAVTEGTDSYNNEYQMVFNTNKIYATAEYNPDDSVNLSTHVQLVAQWAPIELTVMKTVNGLTSDFWENHTYDLIVQKQNANGEWVDYRTVSITIYADGNYSETLSPVPAGTYRVIEAEGSKVDLTKTSGNVTTTLYLTVSDGETIKLDAQSPSGTLNVLNSYSETKVINTTTVTVSKNVTGLVGEKSKDFNFMVEFSGENLDVSGIKAAHSNSAKTVTDNQSGKFEFTLKHGETVNFEDVPIGATVKVTEVGAEDYEVSSDKDTTTYEAEREQGTDAVFTFTASELVTEENKTPNQITVTNHKTIVPDAGVELGTAVPYLITLSVSAAGALSLRRKRKE